MLFAGFGLRQHHKCIHSEEKSCNTSEKHASFHMPFPNFFSHLSINVLSIFSQPLYTNNHHIVL